MAAGSTAVLMAALVAVALVALTAAQEPAWAAGCGNCNRRCVARCERQFQRPCLNGGNLDILGRELCEKGKPAALKLCKSGCYSRSCATLGLNGCPRDVDKLCTACRDACNDGSCTSDECRADCVSANCVKGSGCPASSP